MQESPENALPITTKMKMDKIEELRELENKFQPLSRFTVFYNTSEREGSNITNNHIKHEDQTETEGSHADNNTNTNYSKTTDRDKNIIDANSVTRTNLDNEDETAKSEAELSVNMHEVKINKTNKEQIKSFLGNMKNEYEIITVKDETEPVITTETVVSICLFEYKPTE